MKLFAKCRRQNLKKHGPVWKGRNKTWAKSNRIYSTMYLASSVQVQQAQLPKHCGTSKWKFINSRPNKHWGKNVWLCCTLQERHNCFEMMKMGVLPLLQQTYHKRKYSIVMRRQIARILGNLSVHKELHNRIIKEGEGNNNE